MRGIPSRISIHGGQVQVLQVRLAYQRMGILTDFLSGVMSAMSAMVNLEIPWINVMSKMDLVLPNPEDPSSGGRNGLRTRRNIARRVSSLV